jgi:hypothetical protein
MEIIENKSRLGNRIFYIILILLIIGSVGVTFYKIVIQKDYLITAETSCDPTTEKGCYVWTCDPADDATCPANEAERTSYYKMVSKSAADIYTCEQTEEKLGCSEELSCVENEASCFYIYCDPANLADGEACVTSTQD